jgi:hypothetical protein
METMLSGNDSATIPVAPWIFAFARILLVLWR